LDPVVKVSVACRARTSRFLDAYAKEQRLDSRSAALHRAIRILRTAEIASAYEAAWEEWATEGDATAWEPTTGDGLKP
jgi:hypothetical protein